MSTQIQDSLNNAAKISYDSSRTERILEQVKKERERQINKWGIQVHDPKIFTLINGEEMGETAENALKGIVTDYVTESVQVAAVAVAACEAVELHLMNEPKRTEYKMSDDEIIAYNKLMYYVGTLAHSLLENDYNEKDNALEAIIQLSHDWFNEELNFIVENDYLSL